MPYDFPRRPLRDGQILDPEQINNDVDPVLRSVGKLDRHNLSSDVDLAPRSDNANQANGYYNHHHTAVSYDPGMGTPGAYSAPSPIGIGSQYVVPNSQSWTAISSCTVENITCELSNFWIHAFVQYFWLGYQYSGGTQVEAQHYWSFQLNRATNIQFALRVDGVIVPGTLTGHSNPYDRVPQPWRWTATRTSWNRGAADINAFPGPLTAYDVGISGIGPQVYPVRLGAHVPVAPGTHNVDIVVRRVDYGNQRVSVNIAGSGFTPTGAYGDVDERNVIIVGNRRLYVVEMPANPRGRASGVDFTVDRLETEETVNNDRLGLDLFKNGALEYLNAVTPGHLQRGALAREHLKSGVLHKDYKGVAPSSREAVNAQYPGFGSHTITPNGMSGSIGWYALRAGGVLGQLRTGSFTVTEPCYIIIKADVHLRSLKAVDPESNVCFGALAIGYEYDDGAGAVNVVTSGTEAIVNCFNVIDPGALSALNRQPEHAPIPLLLVLDHTTSIGRTYNYFQVYGSVIAVQPADGHMTWRYGNISMLVLRA